MRIDVKDNSTVELHRIENGKTFKYAEHYYIATNEINTSTDTRICVALDNGLVCRLLFNDRVIPVNLIVTSDPEEGAKNE